MLLLRCFKTRIFLGVQYHRQVRKTSSKPFFITTPIFYVNGAPHIGHLQSCIYADAFHRMEQLCGRTSMFTTGTDEHGLKIQKAARLSGKDPMEYCDNISGKFKSLFDQMDISYTDFVRTTEERHIASVHSFWERIKRNGYLYKGKYSGWYNVSDEVFVPPSQVKELEDASGQKLAVCCETSQPLEWLEEDNYMFMLSKFEKDLLHWLAQDVVKPDVFSKVLKSYIDAGLQDLSVSRQRKRLSWGIPVPDDPNHTIYVWLDALVNYLTAANFPAADFVWPPTCHIIGKDILKFHGIFWPAFLLAAGLEPPNSIFCHSHWTVNYEKMSKSRGNVIDPLPLMATYSSEGLRYFLLRTSVTQYDTNYSETKIQRLLDAELADTLGNLLSRCCAPAINKHQVFPAFSRDAFQLICDPSVIEMIESTASLPGVVQDHFKRCDFYHGIEEIMECIRKANGFVQHQKPWVLAKEKSLESQLKLDTILHIALEVLRVSGVLLQPIVPTLSKCLLDKLGVAPCERSWVGLHCFSSYHEASHKESPRLLGNETAVLYVRRGKDMPIANIA